ncbi:hypothetical protein Pan216_07800 [Planctomycetes bacterium Pan216]|uniref:Uncharacterized protein n=1 Tax=Kolteria novifilia TaxID=2527975 RepID=A0A518AYY8_9BACT|nr:hypothetical protein Pan216_07800 [Planctomycetes bacterium Pan216]
MTLRNGLYSGSANGWKASLRIDLKRFPSPYEQLNRVSADLFELESGGPWFKYGIRWAPQLDVSDEKVEGKFFLYEDGETKSDRFVHCVVQSDIEGADARLTVRFLSMNQDVIRTLEVPLLHVSNCPRILHLEIDTVKGTRSPGEVSWKRTTHDLKSALERAGIDVKWGGDWVEYEDLSDETWSEAELNKVMKDRSEQLVNARDWRLYLFVAKRFRDPRTTGIMFDVFGRQRQGCALFEETRRSFSRPAEFPRDYLRTAMHEIGHAFNLRHSFDSKKKLGLKLLSSSYMNYPDRHAHGSTAYWKDFDWDFDDEEMDFIRHGQFDRVVMGGASYSGHGQDNVALRSERESENDSLRLEIRLSPKERSRRFEFGEPIYIEAKLANRSNQPKVVEDTLAPEHLSTIYLVEKPDGTLYRHTPRQVRCGHDRELTLIPEANAVIYESVCLSVDYRGQQFLVPGNYTIQAIHEGHGRRLVSNALRIYVGFPDAVHEELVEPFFESDVIESLDLWGSPVASEKLAHLLGDAIPRCQHHGRRPRLISEHAWQLLRLQHTGYKTIEVHDRLPRLQKVNVSAPECVPGIVRETLLLNDTGSRMKDSKDDSKGRIAHVPNLVYGWLGKHLVESLFDTTRAICKARSSMLRYLKERGLPETKQQDYFTREDPDKTVS